MKKLVIAATALLISTQAVAVDAHIKVTPAFGCISKTTFGRVFGYAIEGDQESLEASMTVALIKGNCILFEEKGEGVFIDDTSGTLVRIRSKGATQAYWTHTAAIN